MRPVLTANRRENLHIQTSFMAPCVARAQPLSAGCARSQDFVSTASLV
jgi:hypothetical protein